MMHATTTVTRRSFLWGIAITPFLARPLKALHLPVKERESCTISYWCKETSFSPEANWVHTCVEWRFDEQGYSYPVRSFEDGREVPIRPVHLGIRPTYDGETRAYRIGYASLPIVDAYKISDLTVFDEDSDAVLAMQVNARATMQGAGSSKLKGIARKS